MRWIFFWRTFTLFTLGITLANLTIDWVLGNYGGALINWGILAIITLILIKKFIPKRR
jgi:hypothetical protein